MSRRYFLLLIFNVLTFLLVLNSCGNKSVEEQSDWTLTKNQRDSISFTQHHHYNIGTNFILKSDSVHLASHPVGWPISFEVLNDSAVLKCNDYFVVTEIYKPDNYTELGTDSTWLRVGSDGIHLGWIDESTMLKNSSPTSPISQFIYTFSGNHLSVFLVFFIVTGLVVGYCKLKYKHVLFVHIRDVHSMYPVAFIIMMSTAAMLYSTIQKFFPEMWVTYYFNPSLNPIGQPFLIGIFLLVLWLSLLLLISVVYDLMEKVSFFNMCSYVLSLVSIGCIMYVILTLTIPLYFGYLIYVFYVLFTVHQFLKYRTKFLYHLSNIDK